MAQSIIDRLGEKGLHLVERLYLLILDILIKITPAIVSITEKIHDFDRKIFYPFFERRKIEMKDYTIFKLQMFSAFFLILTTLYIINSLDDRKYIVIGGILLVSTLFILFTTVQREFEDFTAYRDFFLSYFLLAILLAAIKVKKPFVTMGFPYFHFAVVAVAGALVIYAYFNSKHARKFTFGKVLSEKGMDVDVKLNYDIRSNTKPQVIVLRNTMHARVGDTVKVKVRRGLLSLRGSAPEEIIGVDWAY
jgi:uncharacterized membrane protein